MIKHNSITQKDLVILQGKSGSDFNGTVYVWAVDNYDNFGPVTSYKLSVDQTAPAVPSITNPTNGNWTNQDIYLTLNSSDAMIGISYYQYSYDNNAWNTYADSAKETYITTPYSAECNQATYLRVCDYAGNCSNSASTMIRIDKTVPTISYNLAGGTYNSTKSVTVTGSDSNFSYMNVHVYKNGVYDGSRSVNNKTTNTHTVSLDSDGTWTVYTQVYDQAGNKHTMGPDNGYGWYYQTYTIQSRIYCDGWYVNEDYLRPVDYGQPCTQIDYSQSTTVTVYQYRYFHRGPDGACEYINNVLHCYCACGNDCIMDGTTANNGIRSCSKPWGYTHWTLNDDCYASGAQGFWNACSSGNNERRTTTKTAYRWYR